MSLLTRMMIHDVVYWEPDGADQFGMPTFKDAVQLRGRWHDGGVEQVTDKGTVRLTKAKVFVPTEVKVGGYLMLGEISEITHAKKPLTDKAYEIMQARNIPKLRGNETLRYALL